MGFLNVFYALFPFFVYMRGGARKSSSVDEIVSWTWQQVSKSNFVFGQ